MVALKIDVQHRFHEDVHLRLRDHILVDFGNALRGDHRGQPATSAHGCQRVEGVEQAFGGVDAQVRWARLGQPVFRFVQEHETGG